MAKLHWQIETGSAIKANCEWNVHTANKVLIIDDERDVVDHPH